MSRKITDVLYEELTGHHTIQKQVTILEKIVDGRKVTYFPKTKRYPYPTQSPSNKAQIIVQDKGNGYDEVDEVAQAIKERIVTLQCEPVLNEAGENTKHFVYTSTKQVFEAL